MCVNRLLVRPSCQLTLCESGSLQKKLGEVVFKLMPASPLHPTCPAYFERTGARGRTYSCDCSLLCLY